MGTEKEEKTYVLRTVGYGNRIWKEFFLVLGSKSIELVIDVRNDPDKAWSGQYVSSYLARALSKADIGYVSFPNVGPPQSPREWYQASGDWSGFELSYEALLRIYETHADVRRIVTHVRSGKRVALLCSELRPDRCHRRLLAEHIASANADIEVRHI